MAGLTQFLGRIKLRREQKKILLNIIDLFGGAANIRQKLLSNPIESNA